MQMPPRKPKRPAQRTPKSQVRELARQGGFTSPETIRLILSGKTPLNLHDTAVRSGRVDQQSRMELEARRKRTLFYLQGLINHAEGRKGSPNEVKGGWIKKNGVWVRDSSAPKKPKSTDSKKRDVNQARRLLIRLGLYSDALIPEKLSKKRIEILLRELNQENEKAEHPPALHDIDRRSQKRGVPSPRQRFELELKRIIAQKTPISSKQFHALAKRFKIDTRSAREIYSRLGGKK